MNQITLALMYERIGSVFAFLTADISTEYGPGIFEDKYLIHSQMFEKIFKLQNRDLFFRKDFPPLPENLFSRYKFILTHQLY